MPIGGFAGTPIRVEWTFLLPIGVGVLADWNAGRAAVVASGHRLGRSLRRHRRQDRSEPRTWLAAGFVVRTAGRSALVRPGG